MMPSEVRELSDSECAAIGGGLIDATFQYGNFKMEIWAMPTHYGVCVTTEKGTKCVEVGN